MVANDNTARVNDHAEIARRLAAAWGQPRRPLPTRACAERLVDECLQLLFPGVLCEREPLRGVVAGRPPLSVEVFPLARDWQLDHLDTGSWTTETLRAFESRLAEALARCLPQERDFDSAHGATSASAGAEAAAAVAAAVVRRLPALRVLIQSDIAAAFNGDPSVISEDEAVQCLPGLMTVAVQRFAHILHRLGAPVLPRMLTEVMHARTGCDIHPGAVIGSGFFIDHATGVVIGGTATIGQNVRLYHGVTLGAKSFARDAAGALVRGAKRHPDIGDNVTVYAHATILGGDTVIGSGSIIGANVWITRSVPPGSVAYITGSHVVVQRREAAGADWQI
jgi:serine O-acetyltransferase